jgi:hypothetical protein
LIALAGLTDHPAISLSGHAGVPRVRPSDEARRNRLLIKPAGLDV